MAPEGWGQGSGGGGLLGHAFLCREIFQSSLS
jgi:hypothetical protein